MTLKKKKGCLNVIEEEKTIVLCDCIRVFRKTEPIGTYRCMRGDCLWELVHRIIEAQSPKACHLQWRTRNPSAVI